MLLPRGLISLRAITGDVTVNGILNAGGVARQFFDVTRFTDAGRVSLTADAGNVVIGSTGLTPEQDAEILKAAETVAIVRSGNFSLGVNILIGLVEHAALRLDARDWDIEITEAHHRRKVDAPSGTAQICRG